MRKRFNRRKRSFNRKRTFRRKSYRRRRVTPKYSGWKIHSYKRKVEVVFPGPAGTQLYTAGAYSFQLGDVPNSLEFSNLYDHYRITGINIKFYPPVTGINTSSVASPGIFYYWTDYDDAAPPVLNDALQRASVKTRSLTGFPFSYYFKPMASGELKDVASDVTPAYQLSNKTWIDAGKNAVPYLGFKWLWKPYGTEAPTTTGYKMSTVITYYLQVKGVR